MKLFPFNFSNKYGINALLNESCRNNINKLTVKPIEKDPVALTPSNEDINSFIDDDSHEPSWWKNKGNPSFKQLNAYLIFTLFEKRLYL